MVGVFGAELSDDAGRVAEEMTTREGYETTRFADVSSLDFGIHSHAGTDPLTTVRETGSVVGVIYGSYYGEPVERADSDAELLRAILSNPADVLPDVDGSFVVVASDPTDERVVIATDKLASHPVYYATDPHFQFSAEVKPFTEVLPDPELDLQAVGDLLSTEFVWGDKTLLQDVSALPPASYLEWTPDGLSAERYWHGEYLNLSDEGYVGDLLSLFRTAATTPLDDLSGTVGVYLSGGLDSRLQVGVLADEAVDLETFTFDANPGGEANLEPARRIASTLDIPNRITEFEPGDFADALDIGVDLTDGMVPWVHYHNLPFVVDGLPHAADTLVHGMGQGELFGDYLRTSWLNRANDTSATEELCTFFGGRETESLLAFDFDLHDSVADAVELERSERSERRTMQDAIRNNFYPNFHNRAARIEAHVVPTVGLLAHGELLSTAQSMPDRFRRLIRGPFDKRIEDPMSRLKYELVRECDRGLEKIPYERTGMPLTYPFALHFLQYNFRKAIEEYVRPKPPGMYAVWTRENPKLRSRVTDLLADAAERPFLEADTVQTIQREHFSGESNRIGIVAMLTTIELWLQNNYDG